MESYAPDFTPSSSSSQLLQQTYLESSLERMPMKKAGRRPKKNALTNFKAGGQIFPDGSLLNKRANCSFSAGSYLVRLQDYSLDFNNFANVIWSVTNHNLIHKYTYGFTHDRYNIYYPTNRYVRWLPQFSNEYITIKETSPMDESGIAVVLPKRDQLENGLRMAMKVRRSGNVPPVTSVFDYQTATDLIEEADESLDYDDTTFEYEY